MQSLWARAGQAHHCRCRACSTVFLSIGRRATRVAGRRKATFAEIFTACYSSVFATAAVVDAMRKDDRRKELERRLEEAKRELRDLRERPPNSPPLETTTHLSLDQMDILWQALKGIYRQRPFMKEIHIPATVSASELISNLKTEIYNAVSGPSLSALRTTDYERLEREVAAEEGDGTFIDREPRSQKQLRQDSLSTAHLVQQLLYRAEIFDSGTTQSPSFDEAKQMAYRGSSDYSFPSIDRPRAIQNTCVLNNRLRALVGAKHLSFKERIGRICYNLMVSAYSPDMRTYNALIVAFDKHGYHAFSDALVHSFFHKRLLKPTHSTWAAVLNHYKSTNNHGQFLRVISCLAGLDKWTGAKIRRRHINDVAQMPLLQTWAADPRLRTLSGEWIWEHAPLSTRLIEMTIQGLLHFKLFTDAATLFISCVRAGVVLSTQSITHLFDECLAALDWRASVRIVRGLMFRMHEWKTLLSQIDGDSATYLLNRTSALADLCGLGNTGGQVEPAPKRLATLRVSQYKRSCFVEFMAEVKATPLGKESASAALQTPTDEASKALFRSKRRLLQIESLWKEYDYIRKSTNSIESKLLYPHFSLSFRTSTALYVGAFAMHRSLELRRETEKYLRSLESRSHGHGDSPHAGDAVDGSRYRGRDTNQSPVDVQQHDTQPGQSKPQEASSSFTAMECDALPNQTIPEAISTAQDS